MKINYLLLKKVKAHTALLIFFVLFCNLNVSAQTVNVTGTIIGSEDSIPIPGVTVILKGTSKGAVSDFDGNYTIDANIGDELLFTYIGLQEQTLKVTGAKLDVIMAPDIEDLEEVVVIGYGAVKKKEITGAMTQVKSEEIENITTSDLGSALQGLAAGVNVISSDTPGGDSEILIRGISSLNDNEPLYVVDGIIQDGNPRIPPSEIETLNILKDAASTAIYGVRGSTGVILITTKQGKAGSLQVRVNSSYAIQRRRNAVPLMNSVEQSYFDVITSRNVNGTFDDEVNLQLLQNPINFQNETNLNDLVFENNAPTQNHNINVSGGTEDITYNVNFGLFSQDGLQVNSAYERFNVRANTVYNKDKLRIQAVVGMNIDDRDIPQNNLLSQAIVYRPTQNGLDLNVIDELSQGGDDVNRLGWVLESLRTTNNQKTTRSNASLNLNYELIDGLTLTGTIGATTINSIGKIIRPYQEIFNTQGLLQTEPLNSYIDNRTRFTTNFVAEVGAIYEKSILDDHKMTFTFFASGEKNRSEAFTARANGAFDPSDTVLDLVPGDVESVTSGFDYTDTRLGLIGRFQYDYKSRYILSSSIRIDKSSKFPTNNNEGIFPSIALAWNISEEPFWESYNSTVNNFRLRLSNGTNGVDRTRSYAFSPTLEQNINYFGYNADTGDETLNLGTIQQSFANELLKWETSTQTNVGVDLAFLKNKLTFSADYYTGTNDDMLFPIFVPPSAGGGNNAQVILNVGNMTNKGVELAAGYRGRVGKVNFRMNGTFTTNKNEITSINGDTDFLLTNDSGLVGRAPQQSRVTALAVGREAGSFYLWRTNGIIDTEDKLAEYQQIDNNARMGDTRFIDQDNNGILDDNDRVYSGSGLPEYEIGYTFNATYKSFDFSMNWYAALGQEVMNGFDAWAYGFGRHKDQIYQWSDVNPVTSIPAYRNDVRRHPNFLGYSDLWLEDGSYLRLRQISLGYSIPRKTAEKWGFNRLRLYTRVQNPLTFTKYSGYNPEVGGGISARGLDKNTGPISIQYTLGVNINF